MACSSTIEAGGLVGRAGGVAARRERPHLPKIEGGERSPSWETWDRICKQFGWPQTFVTP